MSTQRPGCAPSTSPLLEISCLPNEVVRYIVKEFLTAEDEDQFSLVCKHWKQLRDEDIWSGTKLASQYDILPQPSNSSTLPQTRLSKRPFRFFGVRTTGTEGICCKVAFRGNQRVYAMKKARVYPKGEGVPYYMLREIEFLRNCHHKNISSLCAVSLRGSELMMFFPYCPRTLHEALNPPNERNESGIPLPAHITKRFLYQILQGLSFCHDRGVLHRNLKPKHLLLCEPECETSSLFPVQQHWERDWRQGAEAIPLRDLETCNVLISDFALVRTSLLPLRRFTPEVVTLWYRAPEILLAGHYFTSIDVWSVGCVFAEMLTGRPFFAGVCEINQLFEIFSKVGSPTEATWPGFSQLPNTSIQFPNWPQRGLRRFFPQLCEDGLNLLEAMLQLNPQKRIHARDALKHAYFKDFAPQAAAEAAQVQVEAAGEEDTEYRLGLANPSLLCRYLPNMIQIESESAAAVATPPTKFAAQRARASRRIIEINDMFEMSMRTEFLAINLLDRFLAATERTLTTWPLLLDITCLHMASKCEDVSYIGVGDLISLPAPLENEAADVTDREKVSQMLLQLQELVLAALDFRLQIPTVLDFCFCLCFKLHIPTSTTGAGANTAKFDAMCYFAELSLLHPDFVPHRASHIALGIVLYTHFCFAEQVKREEFLDLFGLVELRGEDGFDLMERIVHSLRESAMHEMDTMNQVLAKRYRATGKVDSKTCKPKSFALLTKQMQEYRTWVVALD